MKIKCLTVSIEPWIRDAYKIGEKMLKVQVMLGDGKVIVNEQKFDEDHFEDIFHYMMKIAEDEIRRELYREYCGFGK